MSLSASPTFQTATDAPSFSPSTEQFSRGLYHYLDFVTPFFGDSTACVITPPSTYSVSRLPHSRLDDLIIPGAVVQTVSSTSEPGVFQLSEVPSSLSVSVHDIFHSRRRSSSQSLFWKHLSSSSTRLYGSDHQLSLFDKHTNLWRLDSLSYLFDTLTSPVPGVTSPFVYFGSPESCFPLHTEDLDLHFISYLHSGKPKIWYIIHKSSVNKLLALVDQVHPDAPSCINVLRHKDLLLTPYFLKKKSISFDTIIQEPGQFVVSLPRSYHMGYNVGNNIAEAVNFATDSWIPYGHDAVSCNCNTKSSPLLISFTGLSQLQARTLHLESEQLQIKTNLETQNQVIVQLQTQASQLHSQNDYLKSLLISQDTPSIPVSFIPQADPSSSCSSTQLSQPSHLHVVPSCPLAPLLQLLLSL